MPSILCLTWRIMIQNLQTISGYQNGLEDVLTEVGSRVAEYFVVVLSDFG